MKIKSEDRKEREESWEKMFPKPKIIIISIITTQANHYYYFHLLQKKFPHSSPTYSWKEGECFTWLLGLMYVEQLETLVLFFFIQTCITYYISCWCPVSFFLLLYLFTILFSPQNFFTDVIILPFQSSKVKRQEQKESWTQKTSEW